MDLSNKAISSLDEDLEVSSSDEEVEQRPPVNEEDLLKWSDDEAGRPNTHASWNLNFNLSTDAAAGPSKAQVKVHFSRTVKLSLFLIVIFD